MIELTGEYHADVGSLIVEVNELKARVALICEGVDGILDLVGDLLPLQRMNSSGGVDYDGQGAHELQLLIAQTPKQNLEQVRRDAIMDVIAKPNGYQYFNHHRDEQAIDIDDVVSLASDLLTQE